MFLRKNAESNQRRVKELEKTLSLVKKESSDLKSGLLASQRKEKVLERELKEVKATLKLEKETAEMSIEGYKTGFENLKKENELLLEQMEDIAIESMMKNRYDLMKEYIAGKNAGWKPEKWIGEYERRVAGISSSTEEDDSEKGTEVEMRKDEAELDPTNVEGMEVEKDAEEEDLNVGQESETAAQPEPVNVDNEKEVPSSLPTTTDVDGASL